ncbi:MAG: sugar phosphate isomerase/epimerase [Clostridia bacterium]|nr:sugar phosphate isomerase/epimerase [Clostridia bacterium]
MEYGINVQFFAKDIGLERAAALVAKAGFTQLDYSPAVTNDDWEKQTMDAMRIFEQNGLAVHQTHVPFNRYGKYGDKHGEYVARLAAATEMLGAKFMVAHGDEFDFEHMTFTPEAALAHNHALFLPYVERAARNGYKVAFETVFEDWGRRRYTSFADELKDLILSFDSQSAVCCWDFGHANVSFKKEAPRILREFGSLVQCTHVHDNVGIDSHQLPLTGNIDWKATMDALKSIPYEGILSVEYSHGRMPESIAAPFIALTYQTVEHLWHL